MKFLLLSVPVFLLSVVNLFSYNSGPLIFESVNARSAAMGGPLIALGMGMGENPAGFGLLDKAQFSAGYSRGFLDIYNGFLFMGFPAGSNVKIATGWHRKFTDIEVLKEGKSTYKKQFKNDNLLVGVSSSKLNLLIVGISGKYIHKGFDKFKLSGITYDFGLKFIVSDSLNIGYVVKNIFGSRLSGSSYTDTSVKISERLNAVISAGIYKTKDFTIDLFAVDTDTENIKNGKQRSGKIDVKTGLAVNLQSYFKDLSNLSFSIGGEFIIEEFLGIRLGWNPWKGLTTGLKIWHIDFAYLPANNMGSTYTVSITIK